MSETTEFAPSADPLYRGVPLDYAADFPVLGVPVHFESNSARAIAVVQGAYGAWKGLDTRPDLVASKRARVRLIVHPGEEGATLPPVLTSRMPSDQQLLLHTPGSMALADAEVLESVAYVTPTLLATEDFFRTAVLDALTLLLVTRLDRVPLHAAAIVRNGCGLLFSGPSGIGKSTLAYVTVRAGYRLLSDDTTYVQLDPVLRLWGLPRSILLLTDSVGHFPELQSCDRVRRPDGVEKVVIPLGDFALHAERAGVCLLERRAAPTVEQVTPDEVVREMAQRLEPGFDRFASQLGIAVNRIAAAGAWRLSVPAKVEDVMPLVDTMMAHLGEGA